MGKLSLFNRREFRVKPQIYQDATISDFGGGLNLADNQLTMKTRYQRVLNNWNRNTDGSMSLRWGTKFWTTLSGVVSGDIIELHYFTNHVIAFTDDGEIAKITEAGVATAIWNSAIAALLPGAPSGWSTGLTLGSIDFSEFKGDLIVVNGEDKPLLIDDTLAVTYLQDPATGSNVNTPITKYVTTVSNYMVMAGRASTPSEIYVSSQGTSGVWPGDPAPNDSVSLNLGAWVPENSGAIIGLGSFRNQLMVAFDTAIVVVGLGTYEGTSHVPAVQDNIVPHGIISHRTTITTRNDFIMASVMGWHTAVRNSFGLTDTEVVSELIDAGYIPAVPAEADRNKAFSVWNRLENRYMTFLPNANGVEVWVATSADKNKLKNTSFSRYNGWDWDCGTTTVRGRIFLAKGSKIFQYGNEVNADEDYTADLIGDYNSAWLTATAYVVDDLVLQGGIAYRALVDHTSGTFSQDLDNNLWEVNDGIPIDFDLELAWSDLNKRTRTKFLAGLQADTEGKALFTLEVFVDNFYKDVQTDEYIPAVYMDFVAGDSLGFGGGDQPYGGGRRLRDERPWDIPVAFKIFKIRIHGSTKLALKLITLTILYYMGTHRR